MCFLRVTLRLHQPRWKRERRKERELARMPEERSPTTNARYLRSRAALCFRMRRSRPGTSVWFASRSIAFGPIGLAFCSRFRAHAHRIWQPLDEGCLVIVVARASSVRVVAFGTENE